MDNRKKLIIYISIVSLSLLVLVIGASYAYFSFTSTNSFGSKSISASAPDVGSVTLITGSNLMLNLTGEQMMQKGSDVYYYASSSGPTTTAGRTVIATATTSGVGTFKCNYTLEITKSATNDLYTAFQNWSNKSSGIIRLTIGTTSYDFNTANLFTNNKITKTGTLGEIKSGSPSRIAALFYIVNKKSIDQNELKNKDITLTFSATEFTCSTYEPVYKYWNSNYNSTEYVDNTTIVNGGYNYYIKAETTTGVNVVCGLFNGTEYCLKENSYEDEPIFKSYMESLGATCTVYSTYTRCETGGVYCLMYGSGGVYCGDASHKCLINPDGSRSCY
jgi:hypothetical protein